MSGSISFDRAAQYYDRTRGMSDEGTRRTVELLVEELRGRGPVLEVGVGTGQLAIPLHRADVPVIGIDIAWSMLAEVRGWAVDRFGPLDLVPKETFDVIWRAYDLGDTPDDSLPGRQGREG